MRLLYGRTLIYIIITLRVGNGDGCKIINYNTLICEGALTADSFSSQLLQNVTELTLTNTTDFTKANNLPRLSSLTSVLVDNLNLPVNFYSKLIEKHEKVEQINVKNADSLLLKWKDFAGLEKALPTLRLQRKGYLKCACEHLWLMQEYYNENAFQQELFEDISEFTTISELLLLPTVSSFAIFRMIPFKEELIFN